MGNGLNSSHVGQSLGSGPWFTCSPLFYPVCAVNTPLPYSGPAPSLYSVVDILIMGLLFLGSHSRLSLYPNCYDHWRSSQAGRYFIHSIASAERGIERLACRWIVVPTGNDYFEPEMITAAQCIYSAFLADGSSSRRHLRLSGAGLPLTACFSLKIMTWPINRDNQIDLYSRPVKRDTLMAAIF